MELTDLRIALRRYWFVAVAALIFWLVVGSYMAFSPAPRYEATASLVAEPSAENTGDAIQLASFQLPVILATLESRSFIENVSADLPKAIADADVSIRASNTPGTPLLYVTVNAGTPEAAAEWANALSTAAVRDRAGSVMELSVLDTAVASSAPVSPKKETILVGAAVLGALTGVLAAVVVFRMRRALDVVKEIERRLGLPVIGRIPVVRSLRRGKEQVDPTVLTTTPELVEAFQALRTSLEMALLGAPPESHVIAVTSWGEGEGKSTVAAGLALTTAATGTDVLAVDADLRRPELHARLGLPFGPGVGETGRQELSELVIRTGQRHLWMLRAGTPSRHPADILASALDQVIEFGRARSWRIVLDPPPYHGVAETATVLSAARYVILVVDVRRSKLPELESMTARLRTAGVNVIGVVLNRLPKSQTESAYAPYTPRAEAARQRARAEAGAGVGELTSRAAKRAPTVIARRPPTPAVERTDLP